MLCGMEHLANTRMGNMGNTRAEILARIESFLKEKDISEREFGLQAVGNHKFIRRLRGGLGVTLTSIERAEAFMKRGCEAA